MLSTLGSKSLTSPCYADDSSPKDTAQHTLKQAETIVVSLGSLSEL